LHTYCVKLYHSQIPPGAVLETTYYRYAYFQENGQVLYALSPLAPHEMIPKFVKIRKDGSVFADLKSGILWGTYQVQKYQVTIHVSHAWHDVKLVLKILENGCEESPGRFRALSLEKHFSSASGDFDEYVSRDLVEYNVPHQPFVFIRDWRL
jgi:F-box protein 9